MGGGVGSYIERRLKKFVFVNFRMMFIEVLIKVREDVGCDSRHLKLKVLMCFRF